MNFEDLPTMNNSTERSMNVGNLQELQIEH